MTAATTSKPPAILAAVHKIQEAIGNIPKGGHADFGVGKAQYDYVRADDINEAVQRQLNEQGVIVRPEITDFEYVTRDIGPNRVFPVARVRLVQTYVAIADGSEHQIVVWGEGGGADDKALRKAVTQAQKIANLLTFSIATGMPDPDGQESQVINTSQAAPTPTSRPEASVDNAREVKLNNARKIAQTKARAKGIGSDQLNALGQAIDPDFYNNVEALTKLTEQLSAIQ